MTRTPTLLLQDILESIELIERYTRGVAREEFEEDVQLQDSVIRRLEIIGEAVKGLPPGMREAHAHVPWRAVAGLRDVLIHQYARVDLSLAWATVAEALPTLKGQIREILRTGGS